MHPFVLFAVLPCSVLLFLLALNAAGRPEVNAARPLSAAEVESTPRQIGLDMTRGTRRGRQMHFESEHEMTKGLYLSIILIKEC